MTEETLTWGMNGCRNGTLKDYITETYPLYTELGLFTWEEIRKYQVEIKGE